MRFNNWKTRRTGPLGNVVGGGGGVAMGDDAAMGTGTATGSRVGTIIGRVGTVGRRVVGAKGGAGNRLVGGIVNEVGSVDGAALDDDGVVAL
jgi:hypothetical protein